jgi:ribosomal protein S18 acetylase RimI-like enzyme
MTGMDVAGHLPPATTGLRRFEPSRDLQAVIALLQAGFGSDLEERDRRWLADLDRLSGAGPLLGWAIKMMPAAENVFSGYVWVEDGRVVANASLMRATAHVWTIANVVTEPEYRRRGIARHLVQAAIEAARARGARQVQLQVRLDNHSAKALYRQLGFHRLFSTTTWRLSSAAEAALSVPAPEPPAGWATKRWTRHSRWWVESVLARAGEVEGPPPGPVRQAMTRHGWRGMLGDRLRGVYRYPWAVVTDGGYAAVAAATAQSMAGPHTLEVLVEPRWRGRVEETLLACLLADLRQQADFEVDADVRDDEMGMTAAVSAAGFKPLRTLERMARPL